MTSWVTLSRARPRNPFRSPARIQRGRELARPDVSHPLVGDQFPGQAPCPVGESRAPGEATAMVGDVAEHELERRTEAVAESQPRSVRLPFPLVVFVEDDLDARIDPLGVSGEEIPEPASDLVIRPARKHAGILAPGH